MKLRYLYLASIALLSITACSEVNTQSNNVGESTTGTVTPKSQPQQANPTPQPQIKANVAATNNTNTNTNTANAQPDDITPLFDWMEQECQGGWESESSKLLQSIKSSDPSGNSPKVTPRSKWATPYANTVDEANVAAKNFEGTQGYAYTISFKNASYRGVPVKSYEFWYEPETDYVFEKLHFQNDKFMELKPRFKSVYNEMYEDYEGAQFDAAEKSIRC